MTADAPDNAGLRAQLDAVPPELGDAGSLLWRGVAGVWLLRPDELRVLADAAAEADLIERLQAEVRSGQLVAKGSQGQPVAAPCVSELRQHRACLSALLRQLKLPDENSDEGALTPAQRSAAARSAARARWDRRGA